MSLILYLVLFILMFATAPILMILRSYWGWRYGLFIVFAWVLGLFLHTEAFKIMQGFAGLEPKILVDSSGFWNAIERLAHFPVQKFFFNPFILAILYSIGAVLLPVQLLIMGFLKLQNHPSGSTGHFWVDSEESNPQIPILFIPIAILIVILIASETQAEKEFALHGMGTLGILIVGLLVTSALGGKHRRIISLDKGLSFGGLSFKRKSKQFEPFSKPTQVALSVEQKNSTASIDDIIFQRPATLAAMATIPVTEQEQD